MPKGSLAADEHGAYHFDADAMQPPKAPAPKAPDAIGEANAAANAKEQGPVQDIIDMVKAVPSGMLPALKSAFNTVASPYGSLMDAANTAYTAASHPSATLTSVGNALQNATPAQVGKNVVAPMALGGLATKGIGLAADAADAAAAAQAATPAARLAAGGWKMRPSDVAKLTPGGQPTMGGGALQSVVGDQAAAQAIGPQNALLAQQKAASATGIQLDQHGLIQPSAVADAKAPHAAVYEQMAGVPGDTTPDSYTQALQKIRSDPTLAPETQAAVDKLVDLHSDVGDSASASASIKTLRQKGSNLIGNDNPDFQDRGYAMKGISGALEDVLEQRATDSGQPELAAQFQQARKSYAQISNVEDASKAGMVDPQKLLRARDKGALLTGPLADIANAAEQLPDVVRHQHSFSGGASDVPTTLAGAVQGILRNIGGRKILQGPYQQSLKGTPPVAGLGGEFEPLNQNPAAPEGLSGAIGGQGVPAPGGGLASGPLSLADDLMGPAAQQNSPPTDNVSAGNKRKGPGDKRKGLGDEFRP